MLQSHPCTWPKCYKNTVGHARGARVRLPLHVIGWKRVEGDVDAAVAAGDGRGEVAADMREFAAARAGDGDAGPDFVARSQVEHDQRDHALALVAAAGRAVGGHYARHVLAATDDKNIRQHQATQHATLRPILLYAARAAMAAIVFRVLRGGMMGAEARGAGGCKSTAKV